MEKYISSAYISKTHSVKMAVEWAYNKHNLGQTRIFMLDGEKGLYGVVQNNLARRFREAGYEQLPLEIMLMYL